MSPHSLSRMARVIKMPDLTSAAHTKFCRDLAATAQITAYLAPALQHVHWLFEGWNDQELVHPLGGELQRIYTKQACFAVRACSEVEQHVAVSRAERWGLSAFPALQEQLASCDTTRGDGEELVRAFVRSCLDVFRGHLMNGVSVQTPQEQVALAEMGDEETR